MKKYIGIISVSIVLILLVFYFGTNYHFMYDSVCGTGLTGLKLVSAVILMTISALAIIILLYKRNNKSNGSFCLECNAAVRSDWIICPYCGSDRIGGK